MLGTLARRFANLAFGGRCFLCRGAAGAVLCAECDADLPRLEGPLCPRCALAAPAGEVCGRCLAHPPAYDATVAALGYEFPADALVQALKFRGGMPYNASFRVGGFYRLTNMLAPLDVAVRGVEPEES